MLGAIIGDVCGSRFEFYNTKSKEFSFFHVEDRVTDDSVMTCAVAEALMRSWEKDQFNTLSSVAVEALQDVGFGYPKCGYGARFVKWMYSDNPTPYNSFGNGSAMRISAVGDIARDVEEAKKLAYDVTCISHNHPEGIKGAEAAAVAKVLLKQGMSKEELKKYIEDHYYKLDMTVDDWREANKGHGKEICQVTMPQAFACFFEGESFEDVIRNCISIGGDSDTIAAIAGGIAEAYYSIPAWMIYDVEPYIPDDLLGIINRFYMFKREFCHYGQEQSGADGGVK